VANSGTTFGAPVIVLDMLPDCAAGIGFDSRLMFGVVLFTVTITPVGIVEL